MSVNNAEFFHTKIQLPLPSKLSKINECYCDCISDYIREEVYVHNAKQKERDSNTSFTNTLDNWVYCVCPLTEKFSNCNELPQLSSVNLMSSYININEHLDENLKDQSFTIPSYNKVDIILSKIIYYRLDYHENINYMDDEDISSDNSPNPFKEKNNQFDSFIFKPKKGESEEETIERLKNLLKINYNIDVPNDSFEIYFQKCAETNRKRRMLRCNYEGCSKSFKKAWNLFDHMRIHTGDKPFICRICGRGFAQNGNLTKHIKLHTSSNRKIHSCDICGRKYTERFNLRVI